MWNQSIGLSEQETGPGGDFRLERNLFFVACLYPAGLDLYLHPCPLVASLIVPCKRGAGVAERTQAGAFPFGQS